MNKVMSGEYAEEKKINVFLLLSLLPGLTHMYNTGTLEIGMPDNYTQAVNMKNKRTN